MTTPKRADWEAIERDYRAGVLSLRAIAAQHGITEAAIRKRAKRDLWERALLDKVRERANQKMVRADGTQPGSQQARANDAAIVEAASDLQVNVRLTHRRDLQQLQAIGSILATRLAAIINGETPDGPCLGKNETPGDLLEKLARVKARTIPLERQAYSLDEAESDSMRRAVSTKPMSPQDWAGKHAGAD